MEPKNILSIIRGEVNDFLYNTIEVVPGYNFNQYDTIKQCHLYLNSRFVDQSDYQGRPKMFDNKIKSKRDRVAAFLNIDTKDIKIISNSGTDNPYKTVIAQKELEYYLKENDYAQKLNDMGDCAVDFGSVVIKKTKKGAELTDLRRFFCDPTVDNLQRSRFITFKHLFTISELKARVKDGWNEGVINDIIEKKRRELNTSDAGTSYEASGQVNIIRSSPYIEVYERFGEVEQGLLDGKGKWDDTLVKALFICANPMSYSMNEKGEWTGENGGVLFKSKWKGDYPVDEYHYYKTWGRWLGIGVVESLFLPQERINELVNQKRVSMELSVIHLFQKSGKSVVQNLVTDLVSGDLLDNGGNEITPVVNEERNLSAFQSEEQYYMNAIDEISFISQQATGGAVPSSTPATNVVVQQNNTLSVFNLKRQNYANMVRRFLRKHVLDDILTEMNEEHVLRFAGDYEQVMKLNLAVATSFANSQVRDSFLSGKPVSPEDYQGMIDKNLKALKDKGELHLQITKGWFDDVDLDFDILIDNEQQATDVISSNKWQVIQALSANPQALDNPVIKALLMDYAEGAGINPLKLESMDVAPQQGKALPQLNAPKSQVGQSGNQPATVGNRI